ncbi:hypothetical protein LXL04_017812 [Taraxacum kok-saghyz]
MVFYWLYLCDANQNEFDLLANYFVLEVLLWSSLFDILQYRFMMTQLEVVMPWMVVVANIPVQSNEEGDSCKELMNKWIKQGNNPIQFHPLGHSEFVVVEFGKEWNGLGDALKFVKDFEANKHGRRDWYDEKRGKDNNRYAWIAKDED